MFACRLVVALWVCGIVSLTSFSHVVGAASCGTGSLGIRSCFSKPDGKYQHCDSCKVWVVCKGYVIHKVCPCPTNMVWDDVTKECVWWAAKCEWTGTEAELLNCGPESITSDSNTNTITCITFDLFDLDGNFIASNGIFLENYGVVAQPNCGLGNNCGRFSPPSRLQMPRFTNADFFELTVSLWFKGTGPLVTNGVCSDASANTSIAVISASDTSLHVKVRTVGSQLIGSVPTPAQSGSFHHVVVTFWSDVATEEGRARIYFDGTRVAHGILEGKMLPVSHPMVIGAEECPTGTFDYFKGQIDSVNFARTELSANEVKRLFESNGKCIEK